MHPNLLVRFAQSRVLNRFARVIETSSGQRDLTGVMSQAGPADRQRDVPGLPVWIDQEECSGWPQAGLERGIGPHQWTRCHTQLRLETRQRPQKTLAQRIGQ
jgi:hypothetical protein